VTPVALHKSFKRAARNFIITAYSLVPDISDPTSNTIDGVHNFYKRKVASLLKNYSFLYLPVSTLFDAITHA